MAMYTSGALEELKTCPYNPSHRVLAKKFNMHLVKCQKVHPNVKVVTCPIFAEHRVPEPELAHHVETCTKRKEMEQQIFYSVSSASKWEAEKINIQSDEVWDVGEGPSYNPQAYCEQNRIIRQIKVEPPSVRKQFRISERERHQNLERQELEKLSNRNERSLKDYSETSEKETGITSTSNMGYSQSNASDSDLPKKERVKLPSKGNKTEVNSRQNKPSGSQNDGPGNKESQKILKENARAYKQESGTTSDASTLCDTFSDISLSDIEGKEEKWIPVTRSNYRGRGRGRLMQK